MHLTPGVVHHFLRQLLYAQAAFHMGPGWALVGTRLGQVGLHGSLAPVGPSWSAFGNAALVVFPDFYLKRVGDNK